MAIIYTYPRLANPQGNELIVVSDVNNKNATRLVTIDSIASLVPASGGDGCSRSISTLTTPNGDLTVSSCDAPVAFTSTDGSIDISAPGANNINLQAGCVTTYVLKPVVCGDGESISTNANDWIFSCNSQLAEFSDADYGSIQITNNGVQVGSEFSQCWDVSVWNPIGSDAQFECCETPSTAYLYNICSTNSGVNMPASLILPTYQSDRVIVTDQDNGNQACYEFQQKGALEPTPGNYTAVALQENQNCNTSPCLPSIFTNKFRVCGTQETRFIADHLKKQAADGGLNFLEIYVDADTTANSDFIQVDSTQGMSLSGIPIGSPICYNKIESNTDEPETSGLTYSLIPNADQDCNNIFFDGYCTGQVVEMISCQTGNSIYIPVVAGDGAYVVNNVYNLTFASGTQPGTGVERSTLNGCYTASNVTTNVLSGSPTNVDLTATNSCDDAACQEGEDKWVYYECAVKSLYE